MALDKKAILVVSFGTSYPETRKLTIEAVENKIKQNFPDYEIRRAYTSGIIRRKIKKQENICIDSTKEALEKLKNDNFEEVIVQPLHIIPGIEYDDVKDVVSEYKDKFNKLIIGEPMLYEDEDYKLVINALNKQIEELDKNKSFVIMGHGTSHYANASYALLQYMLEEAGLSNVFVGTVEGYPTLDNVIRRLNEKNIKDVILMPFMLVAGDHAQNDMAGSSDDSWKSILKRNNINSEAYIHGLGENKFIQDIYISKIKSLLK